MRKVYSAAIIGLSTQLIEIEADLSYGFKNFEIVGLPDKAVEESKERIKAAIKTSGFSPPLRKPERIIINLAPADLKKEGSLYDLPIAISYLVVSKQINLPKQKILFLGELSLDGKLRPIKGALLFALFAQKFQFDILILPQSNYQEASLVYLKKSSLQIFGASSLKEVVDFLNGKIKWNPPKLELDKILSNPTFEFDIGYIKGQNFAKRALEIAAAGAHNLLFIGPPGGGKTLLAKSLPTILPPLHPSEILEVTQIYSIVGLLLQNPPIITQRPFRAPHHSASKIAIIGGGNPPLPGEITLAHRGVLFLDEFPEFRRDVIEALRQPLEEGKITIQRSKVSVTFPAKFMLVAASNPCPCGYLNDPLHECICSPSQIAKYKRKMSGPIIDRIDLLVELPYVKFEDLIQKPDEKLSPKISQRVAEARLIQKERFKDEGILTNSEMNLKQIEKYCKLGAVEQDFIRQHVNSGKLSARGFHRVLKVARTIADLEKSPRITLEHLSEALMYRLKSIEESYQ